MSKTPRPEFHLDSLGIPKAELNPKILQKLPPPPPWRTYGSEDFSPPTETKDFDSPRARAFVATPKDRTALLLSILLRKPLLITGLPGIGKSSMAEALARYLQVDAPLVWSINSKSTLQEGLYSYRALDHLYAVKNDTSTSLGDFLSLGPLGQALAETRFPRVVLIDEIDKGDYDLPNDLLNVIDRGSFVIPEAKRVGGETQVQSYDHKGPTAIKNGVVQAKYFPIVLMTSNGERDFPPAFKRRCLQHEMVFPREEELRAMLKAHLPNGDIAEVGDWIQAIAQSGNLAHDFIPPEQLINAVYLAGITGMNVEEITSSIIRPLSGK